MQGQRGGGKECGERFRGNNPHPSFKGEVYLICELIWRSQTEIRLFLTTTESLQSGTVTPPSIKLLLLNQLMKDMVLVLQQKKTTMWSFVDSIPSLFQLSELSLYTLQRYSYRIFMTRMCAAITSISPAFPRSDTDNCKLLIHPETFWPRLN